MGKRFVVHISNPSTGEAVIGTLTVKASLGYIMSSRIAGSCLKKQTKKKTMPVEIRTAIQGVDLYYFPVHVLPIIAYTLSSTKLEIRAK
jgi:hypothetical protein